MFEGLCEGKLIGFYSIGVFEKVFLKKKYLSYKRWSICFLSEECVREGLWEGWKLGRGKIRENELKMGF